MAGKKESFRNRNLIQEVDINHKYDALLRDLDKINVPIEPKMGQADTLRINQISHPLTLRELKECAKPWQEVLRVLKRHKNFFKVDFMMIAMFSVDAEKIHDEDKDEEWVMENFLDEAFYFRDIKFPLPIDVRERFHLKTTKELTKSWKDLDITGYLQKDSVWIPLDRIVQIQIILD